MPRVPPHLRRPKAHYCDMCHQGGRWSDLVNNSSLTSHMYRDLPMKICFTCCSHAAFLGGAMRNMVDSVRSPAAQEPPAAATATTLRTAGERIQIAAAMERMRRYGIISSDEEGRSSTTSTATSTLSATATARTTAPVTAISRTAVPKARPTAAATSRTTATARTTATEKSRTTATSTTTASAQGSTSGDSGRKTESNSNKENISTSSKHKTKSSNSNIDNSSKKQSNDNSVSSSNNRKVLNGTTFNSDNQSKSPNDQEHHIESPAKKQKLSKEKESTSLVLLPKTIPDTRAASASAARTRVHTTVTSYDQDPFKERVKFTDIECNNVIQGVKKFGVGKWSKILAHYDFHPSCTNVSIKDKYRTLLKHGLVQK